MAGSATRKPTQTPKPIAKKTTPKMPGAGPMTKVSKPKPIPEFTMPTVADYRSSAASRGDNPQTYKEYVYTAKAIYDSKYKKQKGK